MIAIYESEKWKIVTQRSHAHLAAQFCQYWEPLALSENALDLLIATAEHDDVYNELLQDDVLDASGVPLNFDKRGFNEAACSSLFQLALLKSHYVALLVARHLEFLYKDDSAATVKFFNKLEKDTHALVDRFDVSPSLLDQDYAILQWCDAISLIICQQQIPPASREIEVAKGPDTKPYYLRSMDDEILEVEPWPFRVQQFGVYYEYRLLTKITYENDASFREDLEKAPVSVTKYTIRNGTRGL